MVKRWRKWIKAKRKKYVKYFKEWCPFDGSYLYNPIKMILEDKEINFEIDVLNPQIHAPS